MYTKILHELDKSVMISRVLHKFFIVANLLVGCLDTSQLISKGNNKRNQVFVMKMKGKI